MIVQKNSTPTIMNLPMSIKLNRFQCTFDLWMVLILVLHLQLKKVYKSFKRFIWKKSKNKIYKKWKNKKSKKSLKWWKKYTKRKWYLNTGLILKDKLTKFSIYFNSIVYKALIKKPYQKFPFILMKLNKIEICWHVKNYWKLTKNP